MIRVSAGSFDMGFPGWEVGRYADELPRRMRIAHDFWISSTPVTRKQYLTFLRDQSSQLDGGMLVTTRNRELDIQADSAVLSVCPDDDCPAVFITWYLAAQYCNWLNKKEGLTPCYEPDSQFGRFAERMRPKPNFLDLNGFRLPTEAEWEYACRAGTATSRYFGNDPDLLDSYAWFGGNSNKVTHPVRSMPPNSFGLFGMLGNVQTWCHDSVSAYDQTVVDDSGDNSILMDSVPRILRGGSFASAVRQVRAAYRFGATPNYRHLTIGFRIAQTIPSKH